MSIYCNYSVSTNSPESLPGNAVVHLPNINGKQLLFCSICNITRHHKIVKKKNRDLVASFSLGADGDAP